MNVWLTDDSAWREGGGIAIYSHVPPLERATTVVNREFASKADEEVLRSSLRAMGDVRVVEYACNRAVVTAPLNGPSTAAPPVPSRVAALSEPLCRQLFVSDRYHESLALPPTPALTLTLALTLSAALRVGPVPRVAALSIRPRLRRAACQLDTTLRRPLDADTRATARGRTGRWRRRRRWCGRRRRRDRRRRL